MKTNYYALFLVVSLSGMSVAQNSPTLVKGSEMKDKSRPQQINVERNVSPVQLIDTVSAEEINHGQVQYFEVTNYRNTAPVPRTIDQVLTDIFSIQSKIDAVNANEQSRDEAQANGWFDRAYARLNELQNEKQQLENK